MIRSVLYSPLFRSVMPDYMIDSWGWGREGGGVVRETHTEKVGI